MRIKDQEIMNQLKINLDLVMQILLILKNMELEIFEVVVDNLQEKLHLELRLVQLQK